jgi:hypothetical protein
MELFEGYIIISKNSSGSKSDGNLAYLFISPNKIYKLYRAEVFSYDDDFFYNYHLKPVIVTGILHQRIRSISVESIKIVNDPFSGVSSNFNEQSNLEK